MSARRPSRWWCAVAIVVGAITVARVVTRNTVAHATSRPASNMAAIARGVVDQNTRYLMAGKPVRVGQVYVEVQMYGDAGENEHAASGFALQTSPSQWSVGALLSCKTGTRYAVIAAIVHPGDRVTAFSKRRRYQLRAIELPFNFDRRKGSFLEGAVPWAPAELTLTNPANRKIASEKWSRPACDGSATTIGISSAGASNVGFAQRLVLSSRR